MTCEICNIIIEMCRLCTKDYTLVDVKRLWIIAETYCDFWNPPVPHWLPGK